MKQISKFKYLAIAVFLWGVALVCRLKFNGLIYGLDFGLYHPDGSLYTFRTLTLLGHSQMESSQQVSNWYSTHAYKGNPIDPNSLLYSNNSMWAVYKLRILYPLLSMPFVALLGIPGMLVIPSLSYLILIICTMKIGFDYVKPHLSLIVVAFFTISLTVNRWMIANITEGLLVAITSCMVLILIKKKISKLAIVYLLFLGLLSSMTRFNLLTLLAISVALFYQGNRKSALYMLLLSIFTILPFTFIDYSSAIMPSSADASLIHKIFSLPITMLKIGFFEISELAVLDRLFLFFLAFVTMLCLITLKESSSRYFILVLMGLWITGAINGTVGVNFRYQLPLLPFAAWAAISNYSKIYGFQNGKWHERNL